MRLGKVMIACYLLDAGFRAISKAPTPGGGSALHSAVLKPATDTKWVRSDTGCCVFASVEPLSIPFIRLKKRIKRNASSLSVLCSVAFFCANTRSLSSSYLNTLTITLNPSLPNHLSFLLSVISQLSSAQRRCSLPYLSSHALLTDQYSFYANAPPKLLGPR
nr:hypothetical transcript [Hymenolepis microstoma]